MTNEEVRALSRSVGKFMIGTAVILETVGILIIQRVLNIEV